MDRTKRLLAWNKPDFTFTDRKLLKRIISDELIDGVKVGLQTVTRLDEKTGKPIAYLVGKFAQRCGGEAHYDLKLFDTPDTVYQTVMNIGFLADGITIHACGGPAMIKAAIAARAYCIEHVPNSKKPILFGVTVPTSMDDQDSMQAFGKDVRSAVRAFADSLIQAGADGIVCSGHELALRSVRNLISLVPGIVPAGMGAGRQKRIMTPKEAAEKGANYIVLGRHYLMADDPIAMLQSVKRQMGS